MTTADPRSIWLSASAEAPRRSARELTTHRFDVVVVGAGLAGLCTAALCSAEGASVAVVEAGTIAGRTTGHSTAKLTALHGLKYSSLRRKSAAAAELYAAANVEGLARVRAMAATRGIDCDLVEATAYTCATTDAGAREVEEEAAAASDAGLGVELVADTELPLAVIRAVSLAGQAHFDPVAFCRGLADDLELNGVTIIEGTRVNGVDEAAGGCTVTAGDLEIRCDAAVVTTHLPIVDPALLAGRIRPERSYVVAGPVKGPTPVGMYIAPDADWSIRPWRSANGEMLLVGGQGHSMTDRIESSSRYAALTDFATDELAVEVRHRWSAFDYTTTDGLPYIGRLTPRSGRRWVATGFHKWGMTTSMVAAMIISDGISGRSNPYAETFDSTRLASTLTPDLLANTAKVASHFVGDRLRARCRPADSSPAAGEGIVVRRDGKTVAIARDASGRLYTVDAACTHLGCIVAFNDGDHTWDCPCHGSRFALDGTVLDGPASRPLATVPSP